MPKKTKVVDYRSVNLAWLITFKDCVLRKELAPDVELVVAQEPAKSGAQFEVQEGDTLCVTGETTTAYTVSRPYGDVRTGEVSKSAVSVKPREEWSTEDVAEYVIKRACMKDQCTYLEVIEKPKKNVSKKEYKGAFVSQARRCRFADLVGALEYFYTLKKAKIAKQYVWLDVFSANQPKLTARNVEPAVRKENEQQLTEGLHVAIANFEQRVMFMDKWDGAAPLTRAWCVWEIFGVAKAQKPLEIALPESEYDRFIVTLKDDYGSIIKKAAAVDVEKAKCFNLADLEMIHNAIRTQASFQVLDDIVKTQLRLWVASTGKLQVEKEEKKANPDLHEISLLANQAGLTYHDLGDFISAGQLLRKALVVAEKISKDKENDGALAARLNNLAEVLRVQREFDKAEPLYRQALAIYKRIDGDEHPSVAAIANNLGQLLRDKGKVDEAELMYRQALEIWKKVHGDEHQLVATGLNNLAGLLHAQGKLDEAEQLYKNVIAILEDTEGKDHPHYASALSNLAGLRNEQGNFSEAMALYNQSIQIFMKVFGEEHLNIAVLLNNMAEVLMNQGKTQEAQVLRERALYIYGKSRGDF